MLTLIIPLAAVIAAWITYELYRAPRMEDENDTFYDDDDEPTTTLWDDDNFHPDTKL